MNTFNLPEKVVEFFRAGRQLDYNARQVEPGEVRLKHFDELTEGEVWVGTDMITDPHYGEQGYYAIPAVSLTGECRSYDPDFILLWLPNEKLFGTWDCDHWILKVFMDVCWRDIVLNPAPYINAQWDLHDRRGVRFVPWPKYAFRTGKPF